MRQSRAAKVSETYLQALLVVPLLDVLDHLLGQVVEHLVDGPGCREQQLLAEAQDVRRERVALAVLSEELDDGSGEVLHDVLDHVRVVREEQLDHLDGEAGRRERARRLAEQVLEGLRDHRQHEGRVLADAVPVAEIRAAEEPAVDPARQRELLRAELAEQCLRQDQLVALRQARPRDREVRQQEVQHEPLREHVRLLDDRADDAEDEAGAVREVVRLTVVIDFVAQLLQLDLKVRARHLRTLQELRLQARTIQVHGQLLVRTDAVLHAGAEPVPRNRSARLLSGLGASPLFLRGRLHFRRALRLPRLRRGNQPRKDLDPGNPALLLALDRKPDAADVIPAGGRAPRSVRPARRENADNPMQGETRQDKKIQCETIQCMAT